MALIVELFYHKNHSGVTIRGSAYEQNSPQGIGTMLPFSECDPISQARVNAICTRISLALTQVNYGSRTSLEPLELAGRGIWTKLLPKWVLHKLMETHEKNLILILDQELCQIPWELAHNTRWFLTERFNIGRIVRSPNSPKPGRERTDQPHILIAADPRGDLPHANKEGVALYDKLHPRPVDLLCCMVGKREIADKLNNYDIVHYTGHSTEDCWLLADIAPEGPRFTIEDIQDLATLPQPFPRIVVSNSCRSAISGTFEGSGLARAFLEAGVCHYIGTLWEIQDSDPAVEFAVQLYQGIMDDNMPIGEAMARAKTFLMTGSANGRNDPTWASYIMYGNPEARMFDLAPLPVADQETQAIQTLLLDAGNLQKQRQWQSALDLYKEILRRIEVRPADSGTETLAILLQERVQELAERIATETMSATPSAEQPTRIGPYQGLQKIGAGGYQTVYLAEDDTQQVALGVPHNQSLSSSHIEQLTRLKDLTSDNLVKVLDVGIDDATAAVYIAYEYLPEARTLREVLDEYQAPGSNNSDMLLDVSRDATRGPTSQTMLDQAMGFTRNLFRNITAGGAESSSLEEAMKQAAAMFEAVDALEPGRSRLPVETTLRYAAQICQALGEAHATGITHGDLCPQNILITSDNQVKVKDVGLSEITGYSHRAFAYVAPEQLSRNIFSPDADIWAVGVLLYEMLTGELPFGDTNDAPVQVVQHILYGSPKPPTLLNPEVSWEVSSVVLKALDHRQRYESAKEIIAALEKVKDNLPLPLSIEEELQILLKMQSPLIYLVTEDENRAMKILGHAAAGLEPRPAIYDWSITEAGVEPQLDERFWQGKSEPTILVLRDFHPYLDPPPIQRSLETLYYQLPKYPVGSSIIFISPLKIELPEALERQVAVLGIPDPNQTELRSYMREQIQRLEGPGTLGHETANQMVDLAWSAQGLSFTEVGQALRLSHVRYGQVSTHLVDTLFHAKEEAVRQSGALEFVKSPVTFADVGGIDPLRLWVQNLGMAIRFSDWAPVPKGWLLMGLPGCGKSLVAQAIAGEWQLPLLKFEMSRVLSSPYVGEAESMMYRAIAVAEQVSPAVLWIDEIEKGFGITSRAQGTMTRLLGILLTWLQERTSPVFVAATVNNTLLNSRYDRTMQLAPELLRAGRFDSIFFLDLPDESERQQIIQIALRKYMPAMEGIDIEALAYASDKASGAEIEHCMISALYNWKAKPSQNLQVVLLDELKQCRFLADVRPDDMQRIRDLGKSMGALSANTFDDWRA